MYLRRIDLNLLLVFDVLMQERNITRSAIKLNMSQPAVSHALSRLRQHLDDPLLVRVGDTMQPSARALEIQTELHHALTQIEQTLSPRPHFEPSSSEREFTISTTDYVEAILLPPLLARLQKLAPGITLHIRQLPAQLPLDELENGLIDMVIGRAEDVPKRFRMKQLLVDDYLCAMANNHELVGQNLTLARFAKQEHLLVAPEAKRKQVAKLLYPNNQKQPKIIASLPHFLAALSSLKGSNFILTGPTRLLKKFEKPLDLYLTVPPFAVPPFQVSMVWHQLKAADQGMEWLRGQLEEIAAFELVE
jgi:DNA-binding transcriptional LysR family regulator